MYRVIPVLLLLVVLFSCEENKEFDSYTIGDDFIQSETNIALVDTFEVELSTFKLDSIATSNTNVGLIGSYNDTELGQVTAKCYSQFGLDTGYSLDDEDVYDSLTVKLRITSGGFYGDSTKLQKLNVYRLKEEYSAYDDGYLYNTTSFEYESEPIGTVSYYPEDYSGEDLEIRLSDNIGRDLFNKMRDNDEIFDNTTKFLQYFPGVVIAAETDDGCIISTEVSDTLFTMNLYTSRVEFDVINSEFTFPVTNTDEQFNQLASDRTGTDAEALTESRRDDVSSNLTNMKSYVQGGLGYYTRVEIPGLYRVLEMSQRRLLLKSELIIKPVHDSYGELPLPTLSIYESDQINSLLTEIVDSNDEALVASPVTDTYYPDNTYYSFDVTTFISTELADGYFDVDHGLVIGINTSSLSEVLDRLVISDSRDATFRPYLKLYYVFYQ